MPDFKPANIIRVPYDNTMVNSIDVDDHDADRQPKRHQLDLLFLQR